MKSITNQIISWTENETHPKTKLVFRVLLLSYFLFNTCYMMLAYNHFFGSQTFGLPKEFNSNVLSDWLQYILWNPDYRYLTPYYLAAHLLSLLFGIFGIGGRITIAIAYYFTINILNLNLSMLDGGHNIAVLLFFTLIFMNTSGNVDQRTSSTFAGRLMTTVSNTAFLIARLQVVTLYLTAVLHKLQGHLWTRGVALYYILQSDEFTHPRWSRFILNSDFLITTGTYCTLIFQMAYPTLVWFRSSRPFILLIVAAFHISTIYLMGLTTFGLAMLVANFLFFPEDWTVSALKNIALLRRMLQSHVKDFFRSFKSDKRMRHGLS